MENEGTDSFLCTVCGARIEDEGMFNDHVYAHIIEGDCPWDDDDHGDPAHGADDLSLLVRCPYPGCTVRTESYNFPLHVYENHESSENHSFDCPICRLMGSETPSGDDFNLLRHLRTAHSDMIPDAPVNTMQARINDRTVTVIEESLDEDKTCPFCLDGFTSNQRVTILGCLCIYHEECYNKYISGYPDLPCIVHSQNL